MTGTSEELFSLIDALLSYEKLPTYTNDNALGKLGKFASEAFERDTFDGYLSYVLISHQVNEDYILLLLRHAQLTLRLHVVPNGFGWPVEKYEEPGVRTKAMFGGLLQSLEKSIEFAGKREFIEACRLQNDIRNELAHRLIERGGVTLDHIRSLARKYPAGNEAVVDSFNEADEDFSYFYSMQLLDVRWDRMIGREIDKAEDVASRDKWGTLRESFRGSFAEEWKRKERTWGQQWREDYPAPNWME